MASIRTPDGHNRLRHGQVDDVEARLPWSNEPVEREGGSVPRRGAVPRRSITFEESPVISDSEESTVLSRRRRRSTSESPLDSDSEESTVLSRRRRRSTSESPLESDTGDLIVPSSFTLPTRPSKKRKVSFIPAAPRNYNCAKKYGMSNLYRDLCAAIETHDTVEAECATLHESCQQLYDIAKTAGTANKKVESLNKQLATERKRNGVLHGKFNTKNAAHLQETRVRS